MTARTGMSSLITELRGMIEAGTADYTVSGAAYWTDDQLQNVLDLHRQDLVFDKLSAYPTMGTAGTLVYQEYRSRLGYFEATTAGASIFYVQDGTGALAGTASWSADYRRGVVTFGSDTAGTAYYVTGRTYDLQAAAAEVWRQKASHHSGAFDFSTDNHSVTRSQVYKHCLEMAQYYESQSGDSVVSVPMYRSDVR